MLMAKVSTRSRKVIVTREQAVRPTVHLICNAHLDPAWLWEWEEGLAETISTFGAAADLCEQFDGFIFNHNEAMLYEWIEQHDPALFRRIAKLVKRGSWHIMGGWYLQPDCNMPCGEAILRQIRAGREYFSRKFGAAPRVAMNFDPFGHSRGLVQLMAKTGFTGYLFCRPAPRWLNLPQEMFRWIGYDGSRIVAHRVTGFYSSSLGRAAEKVSGYLAKHSVDQPGVVLWGVGNHGGGPSRKDIGDLNRMAQRCRSHRIAHSTPEALFDDIAHNPDTLAEVADDLNPWGPGCYTSQIRVKQTYRAMENELLLTEKVASHAAMSGLMDYPHAELAAAERDMMLAQFHDLLPGSGVEQVEQYALRTIEHGRAESSRVRARAFLALSSGQKRAVPGRSAVLVYNPHPYPITQAIECELQLPTAGWDDRFTDIKVLRGRRALPTQIEQEASSLNIDWRKRFVFHATLKPSCMNRFDVRQISLPKEPGRKLSARRGAIRFVSDAVEARINTATGLVDHLAMDGRNLVTPGAFAPIVIRDNWDSWGSNVRSYRRIAGRFRLASAKHVGAFDNHGGPPLPAVRVIENGDVRTVVESILTYRRSTVCMRYTLPKFGRQFTVDLRVWWNEPDRMLKLAVPTTMTDCEYLVQSMFGTRSAPTNGDEVVGQRWGAVVDRQRGIALTCINEGTYGSDLSRGELRLTLLRSPAYSAMVFPNRSCIPHDRHTPRMDMGMRHFRFHFSAGSVDAQLDTIDRQATAIAERPIALACCPRGDGAAPPPGPVLSDCVIQIVAMHQLPDRGAYAIRCFNPTGEKRSTCLSFAKPSMALPLELDPFEVATVVVDPSKRTIARSRTLLP